MSEDLDDPRPRYVRVADELRQDIERGELKVGDKLPSQAAVAERFGVSHMTVKQALGILRSEGTIVSHQGLGAFVRSPVVREESRVDQLERRIDELEARVHAIESRGDQCDEP